MSLPLYFYILGPMCFNVELPPEDDDDTQYDQFNYESDLLSNDIT